MSRHSPYRWLKLLAYTLARAQTKASKKTPLASAMNRIGPIGSFSDRRQPTVVVNAGTVEGRVQNDLRAVCQQTGIESEFATDASDSTLHTLYNGQLCFSVVDKDTGMPMYGGSTPDGAQLFVGAFDNLPRHLTFRFAGVVQMSGEAGPGSNNPSLDGQATLAVTGDVFILNLSNQTPQPGDLVGWCPPRVRDGPRGKMRYDDWGNTSLVKNLPGLMAQLTFESPAGVNLDVPHMLVRASHGDRDLGAFSGMAYNTLVDAIRSLNTDERMTDYAQLTDLYVKLMKRCGVKVKERDAKAVAQTCTRLIDDDEKKAATALMMVTGFHLAMHSLQRRGKHIFARVLESAGPGEYLKVQLI